MIRSETVTGAARPPRAGVAARQGVTTLADQAVVSVTNFLTGVVVARSCSREELGLYSLGFGVVLLLTNVQTALVSLPYNVYCLRVPEPERRAYCGSTLLHQLALATASMALLAAAGGLLGHRSGFPRVGPLLSLLAVTVPIWLAREYARQLCFSRLRFGTALRIDAIAAGVQLAALVLLSRRGALSARAAYAATGVACALAVAAWAASARGLFVVAPRRILPTLRMNWATARWSLAAAVVTVAGAQLYPWFIVSARGADQAGLFAACTGITAVANPLLIAMGNFLPGKLMHAFSEGGLPAVHQVTRVALAVFGACMAVLCPVLFLVGGGLLEHVYGPRYAAQGLVVGLLALAIVADWLSMPAHYALLLLDRAKVTFTSNVLVLATTVTVGLGLVRAMGALGAAVGLVLGNALATTFKWRQYRLHLATLRGVAAAAGLLAVVWAGTATARELHVDPASPRASDRNAGTRARPLATISAGVARAAPGDTVTVGSGTYRESLSFPRSGGPGRWIRVVADEGAAVAIKGSDVVTGWTSVGGGVWSRSGWRVNSQQVFADGRPLQQVGAGSPFHARTWAGTPILEPIGRSVADLRPGSFYYDPPSATLYVRLADGGDPHGRLIEASVRDVLIDSGASFVELRGLTFSHSNGSRTASMRGIVNVFGSSWRIVRCSFTWGDFAGLSLAGDGHRVVDSVASHNGDVGIVLNGSDAAHGWVPYPGRPPQDILFEGNETDANNYRGFAESFQAGGVKASNACRGVRISRHTARRNAGPGLWFDLGCREVVVEDSTIEGNTGGIYFEISDGAVIARNRIARSSAQAIYVSASSDVRVVDNRLDGNVWGVVIHGEPRAEHPALKRNVVQGNVIANTARGDLVVFVGSPEAADNTSDYNVYSRPGGAVKISWTRTSGYPITHEDLRGFAADTGQDRHSSTSSDGLPSPRGEHR